VQKLQQCEAAPSSIEKTRQDVLDRYDSDPEFAKKFEGDRETFVAQLDDMIQRANGEQYMNDIYHVVVIPIADEWVHLSIKRHDREPIFKWREIQFIKDQLVGERCEGIQLFPKNRHQQ